MNSPEPIVRNDFVEEAETFVHSVLGDVLIQHLVVSGDDNNHTTIVNENDADNHTTIVNENDNNHMTIVNENDDNNNTTIVNENDENCQ